MRRFLALALSFMPTSLHAQIDQTAVIATVFQFVDGFNKGNVANAIAACADQTVLIDDFPPHQWNGAGACARWAGDFDAYAKKTGMTDAVVTLGAARPRISGNVAYVVFPTSFAWKEKGKSMKEDGVTYTFVLQKGPKGWKITAASWADNR
jgi:ketosteroid isomerase-like protein